MRHSVGFAEQCERRAEHAFEFADLAFEDADLAIALEKLAFGLLPQMGAKTHAELAQRFGEHVCVDAWGRQLVA